MRALAAMTLAAALAVGAAHGQARTGQDGPGPEVVAALETCVAGQLPATDEAERACIGLTATPCMETPEGGSTLGIVGCLMAETAAWDVLLNRDWPGLMARARATDESYKDWQPALPSAAEALRRAQRAWLAWREAECAALATEWGGGSHARVIHADCWLSLTAERTIALRARLREEP